MYGFSFHVTRTVYAIDCMTGQKLRYRLRGSTIVAPTTTNAGA